MTTSIDRTSRKGKQPRLSDQLKASDLFPPGHGWNNGQTAAGTSPVVPREGAETRDEAPVAPRQH